MFTPCKELKETKGVVLDYSLMFDPAKPHFFFGCVQIVYEDFSTGNKLTLGTVVLEKGFSLVQYLISNCYFATFPLVEMANCVECNPHLDWFVTSLFSSKDTSDVYLQHFFHTPLLRTVEI